MDEKTLEADRRRREILAVEIGAVMEMKMPARRHHHFGRLQGEPFATADPHRTRVYGICENTADQRDFT
ncbi:hypothetical protein NTCA1_41870 [Novosphingobium sp. TCA1]|nr:hypothetical protein NTCA1_41870 [Novosphingobium sp. TCA1]